MCAQLSQSVRLHLLSWNVWNDRFLQKVRFQRIVHELEQLEARRMLDVACLQEVNQHFIALLQKSKLVTSKEFILNETRTSDYGTLVLARSSLRPTFAVHKMPSVMGRSLHLVSLRCPAIAPLTIGNVHLESLDFHVTREKQLEVAAKALGPHRNAVLCGDFNFCSERNFHTSRIRLDNSSLHSILPDFTDCWSQLRQGDKGYTVDGVINFNTRGKKQLRFDRVMARWSKDGGGWCPSGIELIGTRPFEFQTNYVMNERYINIPQQGRVFCSDHFGLLTAFTLHSSPGSEAAHANNNSISANTTH
jgi:tyrosyl-DNA phosphodiesterase 2